MTTIGVIADTHGYVNPLLPRIFKDVSLILHAGDVGQASVLRQLELIAPVRAVRGNVDLGLRPPRFPIQRLVRVEQVAILVNHFGIWSEALKVWLRETHSLARPNVFVYGHSHWAAQRWEDGMLYFNPGAAGRLRVGLGPSVGLLRVQSAEVTGHIIPLLSR